MGLGFHGTKRLNLISLTIKEGKRICPVIIEAIEEGRGIRSIIEVIEDGMGTRSER